MNDHEYLFCAIVNDAFDICLIRPYKVYCRGILNRFSISVELWKNPYCKLEVGCIAARERQRVLSYQHVECYTLLTKCSNIH